MQRIQVRPEQLFVVGYHRHTDSWVFQGDIVKAIPWNRLGSEAHVYTFDVGMIERLLEQAASSGYQILDGMASERRGLRGFVVGIGAWGWIAKVHAHTLDCWGFEPHAGADGLQLDLDHLETLGQATVNLQEDLRELARTLNREPTPFRATASRWLGALTERLAEGQLMTELATPLPPSIARMARRAHIAGPIVHARTTLAPYTRIDRTRAYGNTMQGDIPTGPPVDLALSKTSAASLARWTKWDLRRSVGLADATVHVKPGPLLPLLPLLKSAQELSRNQTLYPVGTFRGTWCLHELALLEDMGLGEVRHLHRVVTFEGRPLFAPVVSALRELEPAMPKTLKAKRLEHMLYGRCARGLQLSRLGSAPSWRSAITTDLVDARTRGRIEGTPRLKPWGVGTKQILHPIYQLKGRLTATSTQGSFDRPDQAAWITASNRMAMARIIHQVDDALKSTRSGEAIGRIYVDGLDVQCRPSDLPDIDGCVVQRTGPRMDLFRAGAACEELDDGTLEIEVAGLSARTQWKESLDAFRADIRMQADPDGGPFASGRIWPHSPDGEDPRTHPNNVSEPMELSVDLAASMGFGQ
jgi:hypothetical protein